MLRPPCVRIVVRHVDGTVYVPSLPHFLSEAEAAPWVRKMQRLHNTMYSDHDCPTVSTEEIECSSPVTFSSQSGSQRSCTVWHKPKIDGRYIRMQSGA